MNAEIARPQIDAAPILHPPGKPTFATIINFQTLLFRLMPTNLLLCQMVLKDKRNAGKEFPFILFCLV